MQDLRNDEYFPIELTEQLADKLKNNDKLNEVEKFELQRIGEDAGIPPEYQGDVKFFNKRPLTKNQKKRARRKRNAKR